MLNRFTQFGLALALVSFAGIGAAQAQDEDPCMEDACSDPCADGDPCEDPCAGGDPCGDGDGDGGDAGDTGGDAGGDAAGGEAHAMGMTNGKGKIAIMAAIGINLSADLVGDPVVIAPDVSYGVSDKLDVGLYHTNYGITGFWGQGAGPSGICAVGDLCGDAYNGPTGILATFGLSEGKLSVAADGGLVLSNIAGDTMFMQLKLGADIRYMLNEKMGIITNPALFAGINERDFNKEVIALPVAFMYAVNEKLHAGVQTGVFTPVEDAGDFMQINLNLGAMMAIDEKLSVGGALSFPNIAGNDGSSADFRSLAVFGTYHL